MSHVVSDARPFTMTDTVWPPKLVALVSRTRRHVRTSLSRVSHLVLVLGELGTEELVVDPVPAAQCRVLPTVAPSMPETMPKKRAAVKGKAPICRTNCPHSQKVTQIPSPSPGVVEAPRPDPPVASPSAAPWPPLFEESLPLGSGKVGPDITKPPGELSPAHLLGYD